jgi:hypothetical protein
MGNNNNKPIIEPKILTEEEELLIEEKRLIKEEKEAILLNDEIELYKHIQNCMYTLHYMIYPCINSRCPHSYEVVNCSGFKESIKHPDVKYRVELYIRALVVLLDNCIFLCMTDYLKDSIKNNTLFKFDQHIFSHPVVSKRKSYYPTDCDIIIDNKYPIKFILITNPPSNNHPIF